MIWTKPFITICPARVPVMVEDWPVAMRATAKANMRFQKEICRGIVTVPWISASDLGVSASWSEVMIRSA